MFPTVRDAGAAGADQQPAQESEPEAAAAQAPEAEADVDVTAETVQTDAAAEMSEPPEKTAQGQSEQSPDNKEVSDDDAAQEQEEA